MKKIIKKYFPKFIYKLFHPNFILFLIRQRLIGFNIPTTPHFESLETTEWFKGELKKCTGYIEYGAGGSTYLAAQIGIPFISIESDKWFIKCLKSRIALDKKLNELSQIYHHADIGLTGPWGQPVILIKPSLKRLGKFAKYSEPPYFLLPKSFEPNLILIDGRFRVACALKTIKKFKDKQGWTILVDDYLDRPKYKIIEKYAKISSLIGKMAVFNSLSEDFNSEKLDNSIEQYEIVPD